MNIAHHGQRCQAEFSQKSFNHNVNVFSEFSSEKFFFAIKANGYGHGLDVCVDLVHNYESEYSAQSSPFVGYALAMVDEIFAIHKIFIEKKYDVKTLLLMGPATDEEYVWLIKNNIEFFVYSLDHFNRIADIAQELNETALVHLKIDTGMHRLGLCTDDVAEILAKIFAHPHIQLQAIATHFANADLEDDALVAKKCQEQIESFNAVLQAHLPQLQERNVALHINNSMGHLKGLSRTLLCPQLTSYSRLGLGLFGYGTGKVSNKLLPVMRLYAFIQQVKKLHSGDAISYGHLWKSETDIYTAILCIGYGDGYPIQLTNQGFAYALQENSPASSAKKYPIRGKICMDQMIVDLGQNDDDLKTTDALCLWGEERQQLLNIALMVGISPYVLLTNISARVPRMIVD